MVYIVNGFFVYILYFSFISYLIVFIILKLEVMYYESYSDNAFGGPEVIELNDNAKRPALEPKQVIIKVILRVLILLLV